MGEASLNYEQPESGRVLYMIPYEDLVDALTNWRANRGMQSSAVSFSTNTTGSVDLELPVADPMYSDSPREELVSDQTAEEYGFEPAEATEYSETMSEEPQESGSSSFESGQYADEHTQAVSNDDLIESGALQHGLEEEEAGLVEEIIEPSHAHENANSAAETQEVTTHASFEQEDLADEPTDFAEPDEATQFSATPETPAPEHTQQVELDAVLEEGADDQQEVSAREEEYLAEFSLEEPEEEDEFALEDESEVF